MTVDQLNEQWQGKYVRTEDPTLAPSGQPDEPPETGNPFGGEGWVKGFGEHDNKIWLIVDWGMEWAILPTTIITEVEKRG